MLDALYCILPCPPATYTQWSLVACVYVPNAQTLKPVDKKYPPCPPPHRTRTRRGRRYSYIVQHCIFRTTIRTLSAATSYTYTQWSLVPAMSLDESALQAMDQMPKLPVSALLKDRDSCTCAVSSYFNFENASHTSGEPGCRSCRSRRC